MNKFSSFFNKIYINSPIFCQDLNRVNSLKPSKPQAKERKIVYSIMLQHYITNFQKCSLINMRIFHNLKQEKLGPEYDPKNLFLNDYDYDISYEKLYDETLKHATTRRWWRRSKKLKRIKNVDSKQTINQSQIVYLLYQHHQNHFVSL